MRPQSTRRIPRRRKLALAALAGVALAAAACSSSSGSSTTTAGGGGSATTSNTPVTLRLGYLTNLTHAAAAGRHAGRALRQEPRRPT